MTDCGLCRGPSGSGSEIWHQDELVWASWCNAHKDKRIIALRRHSTEPTDQERLRMMQVAQRAGGSLAWRDTMPDGPRHYHRHEV